MIAAAPNFATRSNSGSQPLTAAFFVTRNRNDFLRWTVEFARMGEAHRGVLIASRSIAAIRPEPLAYALLGWTERMLLRCEGQPLATYFLDFLTREIERSTTVRSL
jgi:hypothetical protein